MEIVTGLLAVGVGIEVGLLALAYTVGWIDAREAEGKPKLRPW